ncbi:aldehyde reductase [Phyllosticta citriasiana]|uniref:aldehyde reductase n=1 Tax=Phyllosticta citriasiana TaxID=595635 RepID=UPI0030FD26D1
MTTAFQDPVIPKGSTILVTGVNGLIGSHVADQLIKFGYKVRGTVREPSKHKWIEELFEKSYGPGKIELVSVKDMAADGAFDEAIKGVSGVAHVASVVSFDLDPEKVIPPVVAGTLNAAKAAAKEPSVKRFVLTSSAVAATFPNSEKENVIDEKSWNEWSVTESKKKKDEDSGVRRYTVYAASKTLGEQELWKWYRETKPNFVVNTVLPYANLGLCLDPKNQGTPSTAAWVPILIKGDMENPAMQAPPQYYVDTQDTALQHVAGLIDPEVKDERIFGFAGKYNLDMILDILRKHYPQHKFPENFHGNLDLTEIAPLTQARGEEVLKRLGRPGWTPLEVSVKRNAEAVL